MQTEPQVTFHGLPVSDDIERAVRDEVDKLERFCDRITGCHVVIAAPHRRHAKGNLYTIRVDLVVPGGELVVNREPTSHHAHEDVKVALRDAFDVTRRRLQDHLRRQDGRVKEHEPTSEGVVARFDALGGYGFLEAEDGHEVYFHQDSVQDGSFLELEVGTRVHFGEERGERGPQATWVRSLGRAAGV